VRGAWQNTVQGAEILNRTGLPFIVQTTAGSHNLGELEAIADFAHDRLAAKVWNLYFLVPTGRGQFVSDISSAQYDEVLASLYRIQSKYARRMLVNAKCAPHYIKTVLEQGQALRHDSGQAEAAPIRTYAGGAGGCPAGTHYMGIRPNGDVTPCPYLPVFAGNLRRSPLPDLWTSSGLFTDIRRRSSLGGRCGACEMNTHCGGCRARAYGMTGDLMAEDPLCTHTPGTFVGSPLLTVDRPSAVSYGPESPATIAWDDAAAARMKKIPAFVRGMVVRAVEESCRKHGLDRVTVEELERIRARMPTPKFFGAKSEP
jgi:radical SAM protein with 4Fe4S-binding SPASM domain